MYTKEDVQTLIRTEAEKENPHPVYEAFFNNKIAKTFQNDEAYKSNHCLYGVNKTM